MSYQALLAEDQRLVILHILDDMPGHQANDSILQTILASYGHNLSRDHVSTQLHWLAEQALITVDDGTGINVVTITARGSDVAGGRARQPGVKRPAPKG